MKKVGVFCIGLFFLSPLFAESKDQASQVLSKEILKDKDDLLRIFSELEKAKRDYINTKERLANYIERGEEPSQREYEGLGKEDVRQLQLEKSKREKFLAIAASYPMEEIKLLSQTLKENDRELAKQMEILNGEISSIECLKPGERGVFALERVGTLCSARSELEDKRNFNLQIAKELATIAEDALEQQTYNEMISARMSEDRQKIIKKITHGVHRQNGGGPISTGESKPLSR